MIDYYVLEAHKLLIICDGYAGKYNIHVSTHLLLDTPFQPISIKGSKCIETMQFCIAKPIPSGLFVNNYLRYVWPDNRTLPCHCI